MGAGREKGLPIDLYAKCCLSWDEAWVKEAWSASGGIIDEVCYFCYFLSLSVVVSLVKNCPLFTEAVNSTSTCRRVAPDTLCG